MAMDMAMDTERPVQNQRESRRRDMRDKKNEEMEIDLLELFLFLLKKWKLLLVGLILGALLAGGATMLKTPQYQSEAMLFVLSKTTSITSVADLQLGSALSNDFVVIATSKPVLDTAIEEVEETCNVTLTRSQVLSMVSVTNEDNTRVLVITVTGEEPELVCTLANAITDATASQMASIMKSDPPTTIERAEVATSPIDNGLKKNVAMGAIIGFLIVAILYVIPYLMNDKINTAEDVEKYLETGVLGVIPLERSYVNKNSGHNKKKKQQKVQIKKPEKEGA